MRRFLTVFTYYEYYRMNNLPGKVNKLLLRLNDAERRSLLLENEISDIRKEISTLTEAAQDILLLQSVTDFENNTEKLPSTSSQPKKHKRQLDDTDSNLQKRLRQDFRLDDDHVVVYTDGACENNGKPNARAGIGAWFADDHPLNISKPVVGKATNNTAEIQACTAALQCLHNEGVRKVKIITDSQFTINCITNWIKKWKKNNWVLSTGGAVKNKEDLIVLDNMVKKFDNVMWEHVAGHAGFHGNERADSLARQGALSYVKS